MKLSNLVNVSFLKFSCKFVKDTLVLPTGQDNIEFERFLSNFDEFWRKTASSNSLFTITLGDFNARSYLRQKCSRGYRSPSQNNIEFERFLSNFDEF